MSQSGLPRRRSRFSDRMGLDAWSALLTFFNLIGAAVAAVLEPVELSNDEFVVLICLAHAGGALSVGELERASLLGAGRLGRAVDKLEKRRLIAWRRSTADRRKVLIRMKSAGRRLIESLSPAMLELVRSVVEPLGRESTEFMRAKMRKILASAALDLTYADHPLAPTRRPAADPRTRESQWPPTWGLAGWLRCCQWSHHVDRIYRSKFRNLGLTAPRLQVLAVLAGAVEGMTADAVASASGLHQERLTSSLSALERAGLITKSGHRAQPGAGLLRLTTRGEQKMLAALPKANSLADDLYQGLSNEDLERVLSLIPKGCSAASQVRQQYDAARGLTSAASAQ